MLDYNSNDSVFNNSSAHDQKILFIKESTNRNFSFDLTEASLFLSNISLFGRTTQNNQTNSNTTKNQSGLTVDGVNNNDNHFPNSNFTSMGISTTIPNSEKKTIQTDDIVSKLSPSSYFNANSYNTQTYNDVTKRNTQRRNQRKRIHFVSQKNTVVTLISINTYKKNENKIKPNNLFESSMNETSISAKEKINKNKFISYEYLINKEPSKVNYSLSVYNHSSNVDESAITVLKLGSFKTSIIHYGQKEVLKQQENEHFHLVYPQINITYSKYKSVKRLMLMVSSKLKIESIIVSYSLIYFERLMWLDYLKKTNRKICAGACLILACKLHDDEWIKHKKSIETNLQEYFKMDPELMFIYEMDVLVQLEFSLFVSIDLIHRINRTIF